MGERGQVAARAHGPDLGHDGVDGVVEQLQQTLDHDQAAPGLSPGQGVGPKQQDCTHLRGRKGAAGPRRVAPHQVALKRELIVARDAPVGEPPETGVHAVHGGVPLEEAVEEGTRAAYPYRGVFVQPHPGAAARHRFDVRERQPVPVDGDHGVASRSASNSSRVMVWSASVHSSSSSTPRPSARRFT